VRAEVAAHGTIVPLDAAGRLLHLHPCGHDLVVDVTARFPDGDGYRPVGPTRWVDTRSAGARVPAGGTLTLDLADVDLAGPGGAAVAGDDVEALALSVTATGASAPGFLSVATTCAATGRSSNVNHLVAAAVPNLVVVEPDPDGRICAYSLAETDVVVDVVGVFDASAAVASGRRVPDPRPRLAGRRFGLGAGRHL
jgi:hypothetical protein